MVLVGRNNICMFKNIHTWNHSEGTQCCICIHGKSCHGILPPEVKGVPLAEYGSHFTRRVSLGLLPR